MMKRIITIVLVIAVIAGGYWLYSRQMAKRQAQPTASLRTAPVTRGSIEAVVSATGNVAAEWSQTLVFSTSGRVAEVLVKEGDPVEADQVLARLDAGDLELALKQAEAALRVSEAQFAKVQAGPSPEDLAAADVAVQIAEAGVKSAEASVAAAQANLERVKAGASAEDIAIAERRVEEAKNSLWGAQSQRDAICGRVRFGVPQSDCDNAQATVQRLEESVRIAQLQLEQLRAGPKQTEINAAQAQLSQALAQLESARAQVRRAEVDRERLAKGASPEDIAIAQAQVEQARLNVEVARKRLRDLELRAPAAGVLATWAPRVGDLVSPGAPVGTLISPTKYYIKVAIDESEIGRLRVGQPVHVSLDAFPNMPLSGTVGRISLSGTSAQGIVTYDVRVDLDAQDLPLRPMMTAVLDIVVETKENVLLVPNRALRRDKDGIYVEVVENGVPKRINVQVGVSNAEVTEVLAGLEEGQEVVTTVQRENVFSGGPFGG